MDKLFEALYAAEFDLRYVQGNRQSRYGVYTEADEAEYRAKRDEAREAVLKAAGEPLLTPNEAAFVRHHAKTEASRLIQDITRKPGGVRQASAEQQLAVVESVIQKVKEIR